MSTLVEVISAELEQILEPVHGTRPALELLALIRKDAIQEMTERGVAAAKRASFGDPENHVQLYMIEAAILAALTPEVA